MSQGYRVRFLQHAFIISQTVFHFHHHLFVNKTRLCNTPEFFPWTAVLPLFCHVTGMKFFQTPFHIYDGLIAGHHLVTTVPSGAINFQADEHGNTFSFLSEYFHICFGTWRVDIWDSIGLESLENCRIKCIKCYCLILSTE